MTPAVIVAERAGVPFTLHRYRHDAAVKGYGLEAARALGREPARVFKTLLALVDQAPQVAMVPVHRKLDLRALARACSGKQAVMADGDQARRLTGYVLGGISPLGQRRRLPLWLDESAAAMETIYMSAGRRGLEFEMAPDDVLALTGGTLALLRR